MILSPNRSSRGGAKVRLIAIHTAEGSRTKESLGSYFQGPVDASSHVGIDAAGVEQYVPYEEKAWTLLNGNPISENAELCAFARWTRDQWMSTTTVDGCANPKKILDNAADWIRARCLARGIPIRKIDAAAIKRGEAGVIGHVDWTNTGDGSHTDPGPNFPWDYVIARAAGGTAAEENDMQLTDRMKNAFGTQPTVEQVLAAIDLNSVNAANNTAKLVTLAESQLAATKAQTDALNRLAGVVADLNLKGQTQEQFDAAYKQSALTKDLVREGHNYRITDEPVNPTGSV